MKKIIIFCFSLILIAMILSGCNDSENRAGLIGTDEDFFGTWNTGAKSFILGDSVRFNQDNTVEYFWSGSGYINANGTWDRTYISKLGYSIVITMGEQEWTYKYDFFDSYKKLRLKQQGSDEYIYYSKQV